VYLSTLAPSISDANGTGDSGELASTAYTLGIAHPTGYPLYTMLGFLVTHFGGEPAHDLNLFSALMGALTVAILCGLGLALGEQYAPDVPGPLRLVAVILGLAPFTLSFSFWTEATVTETRTLALVLDAAVLALLIVPARHTARHALGAVVLYGLALGDHMLSLFLAPAVILLLWPWAHEGLYPRLATLAGCFAAGLSTYLYLPIRAAQDPAANWGDPDTLGRFLWVVSGQEYRYEMFGLDWIGFLNRLGALLDLLRAQLSPLTLLLAAIGLAALAVRRPRVAAALVITFVLDLIGTSFYEANAAPTYLLLGMLTLAIAAAVGWLWLMRTVLGLWRPAKEGASGPVTAVTRQERGDCGRESVGSPQSDDIRPQPSDPTRGPQSPDHTRPRQSVLTRGPRSAAPNRIGAALVGVGCMALGGYAAYPAANTAHQAVASADNTTVRDRGVAILRGLPRRAVIFATGDAASVPLWYAQRGLGLRSDVTIVATSLLTFAWYYGEERLLPAFNSRLLPPSAAPMRFGAGDRGRV
jgi:hypothetical protein